MNEVVFVFGSNTAGIHGAGAARTAYRQHGARWGKGFGHYGNSFAIPTKDNNIRILPLAHINTYVQGFIQYAIDHPELTFKVTRIGCGLAGLADAEIAPMFKDAPANCQFDSLWSQYLPSKHVWGTYVEMY